MQETEASGFSLHVVPEHQFNGVRIQVVLPFEIFHVESSHMVLQQSDGNNERDETAVVSFDDLEKFPLLIR
jgi:hypothetical protein